MEAETKEPSILRKKMTKQLTGKRDDTPLHSSARAGNLGVVMEILSSVTGTDGECFMELLSKQNEAGETALFIAAEYGYLDVVKEILKYSDSVAASIKAKNGYDAFHIAAKQGDTEILKWLLQAQPELAMTVDLSNTTALHTAANQGHIDVVNLLLEADGSLAKIARSNGKTALHSAARNGYLEIVKALLSKEPGIITRIDKKGQTALHMAVKGQNLEVVEELLKCEPLVINVVDTKGNTALHVSSRKGRAQDKLRLEMESEIKKSGRVSLIDLADFIGVDLYHIERLSQHIVTTNMGLMLIQGEIISQSYWDTIAEEINERLQECSQIALAELAAQLHVGTELITSVLEPRLGTLVKGRLEGGQLYTPGYVARVNAMVRGAARAITVPTNLSTVWNSLQQLLQETDGTTGVSSEGVFFQSLFNGLVKEGEILGSLRAGVHWTPAVFAHAQRESIESFFSQNSFISYDVLYKLAIPQPKQYLQSRYSEGIPLDTVFVHPSMIEMLDTAVEDAIEHGSWIDCVSVLPSFFGYQDASKLLSLCPSVQKAVKGMKATILAETCIFSNTFIKHVFDQIEKQVDTFSNTKSSSVRGHDDLLSPTEVATGHDSGQPLELNDISTDDYGGSKHVVEKGSKKKKGKPTTSSKTGIAENDPDNEENLPTKSKKTRRKSKHTGSSQVSDAKSSSRKDSDKMGEEKLSTISEEWISQRILTLVPEFEGLEGQDDGHSSLKSLTTHLRPMLVASWKEKRNAMALESAEARRRLLDNLQKKLDEASLDLQLYEKALELFEDDPSVSVILHKHLLRTTATAIMDMLLLDLDMDNKLKNGSEVEGSMNQESTSLSSGDRISLAKSLPRSLSAKSLLAVEALEGKRVDTFMTALRSMVEESGLLLRKLDKKLERTLLHSYRKDLISQVEGETDPVALLPKVVSLLYLQVHNKALQAPGRAISAIVSRLKNKLEDSAHKVLVEYHSATVTLLALLSAATGDEEDCSSDRILSQRELLESRMAGLKALALSSHG